MNALDPAIAIAIGAALTFVASFIVVTVLRSRKTTTVAPVSEDSVDVEEPYVMTAAHQYAVNHAQASYMNLQPSDLFIGVPEKVNWYDVEYVKLFDKVFGDRTHVVGFANLISQFPAINRNDSLRVCWFLDNVNDDFTFTNSQDHRRAVRLNAVDELTHFDGRVFDVTVKPDYNANLTPGEWPVRRRVRRWF